MINIIKIAWRNLLRYTRRSLLTSFMIAAGVTLVIIFSGVGNSFKNEIVGVITNSNVGDIQIHKKGYVGSIDNLPLDIAFSGNGLKRIEGLLDSNPEIKSYSERIRFGAMASNFAQTTNMRLTAVYPEKESQTCPALVKRIKEGDANPDTFVKPGSVVIPQNIATGMNLKVGNDIVLIATNKDGSVNGMTFKISGISENIMGPQGKDGYIHIKDAQSLLRIEDGEITEIALKLHNFDKLSKTYAALKNELMQIQKEKTGKPSFEIHTWEELVPFSTIAKIITLLIMVVRVVLFFIVLISILNVMMMSVYERIGEIGTIASIGTLPSKILALFLTEGVTLGFFSAIGGNLAGIVILMIINAAKFNFRFGDARTEFILAPQIPITEISLSIVFVVVISVLASLQPALKASRMEPVEALRHV
ncbi:MAG: ABC transporter substrate-binding protein [Elusimicrobia bacterium RIFOXYA2_FULL_39_19]|nr:MAG: ABC transporter substrate-binding protein [Elusimicrobia bacterium RIFOXYA2_FULL_39_19]